MRTSEPLSSLTHWSTPYSRSVITTTMRGLLLSLCLVAAASATVFQDCGSQGSSVTMTVEGCDVPPCILVRGEIVHLNFNFIASTDSDTLEIDASASIGGVQVPWPGIDTNACHQTTCPIVGGQEVDWNMPVEILTEYPAISTVVTFKLVNNAGDPETCATLPVTIV